MRLPGSWRLATLAPVPVLRRLLRPGAVGCPRPPSPTRQRVRSTGVVNGTQLSDSGGAPESIGPLQDVGGIAKGCSY